MKTELEEHANEENSEPDIETTGEHPGITHGSREYFEWKFKRETLDYETLDEFIALGKRYSEEKEALLKKYQSED